MSDTSYVPVRFALTEPVFIIGAARSGINFLGSLIERCLRISVAPDSRFIARMYGQLTHYGDLRDETRLRRLVDDISKEPCFEHWMLRFGFVLDRTRLCEQIVAGPQNYENVIRAIFEQFVQYQRTERWGGAIQGSDRDQRVLLNLFPHAQFVHVVRDGRDVALSTFKTHAGAGNVYQAALEWQETLLHVQQFYASLPVRQAHTVRFESLLADPAETLRRLAEFLGVINPDVLFKTIAADISTQVRLHGRSTWTSEMSISQQRLFETIAGDQLRQAGYRTTHEGRRQLGGTERLYWSANSLVQKVFRKTPKRPAKPTR